MTLPTQCIIIGTPVTHSLSPQLHNAAYKALGLNFKFNAVDVPVENLEDAIHGIKGFSIRGAACTKPHKETVIPFLDELDESALAIGAVNTIVNSNGSLKGYNTDYIGVIQPLLNTLGALSQKKVAVLGNGGAARAAVYGLIKSGAHVTVYGRSLPRINALAKEFGCDSALLSERDSLVSCEIIINATSLGMNATDETVLLDSEITSLHTIFDMIYLRGRSTKLISSAKERRATTISGIEMLLHQGIAQFELFTQKNAPADVMKRALELPS